MSPGSLREPNRRDHLRARLEQVRGRGPELENGDGLRKSVHASTRLKGNPQPTENQAQDRVAIGGMRHPRFSVLKIPGHREVGSKVAEAIEHYLNDHPHMESKLLGALGTPKELVPQDGKPSADDVAKCLE